MKKILEKIWFLNRSIVSEGFEKALKIIDSYMPLIIHKVPSGTHCFDWVIPPEWVIKAAWIKDEKGNKLIDLKDSPLHVIIGSQPIDKVISREELLEHVQTSLEHPDAIPYHFSYYGKIWGFCATEQQKKSLKGKKFHIFIDSKEKKGNLLVGEHIIKGRSSKSIALIAHLDHPGQVQDGISGCVLLVELAKKLAKIKPYYTLRFLILPERIGSIAYLSQYPSIRKKLIGGIFAEMISTPDLPLVLQHSFEQDHILDRVAKYVMKSKKLKYHEADCFEHVLNDDGFLNAPGIEIPCLSISRSLALTENNKMHHKYYHTSKDDMKMWDEKNAEESLDVFYETIKILSEDRLIIRNYEGVPFLSKYNLWPSDYLSKIYVEKILNHLDNTNSMFTLAEKYNVPYDFVYDFVKKLEKERLVTLLTTEKMWNSK